MKKLLLPIVLLMVAYGASAQKLRVHCLAELSPAVTRFDSLQCQERFFRKRSNATTIRGRYMYFAAECTARLLNTEHCVFDRKTGRNYLPKVAQMK